MEAIEMRSISKSFEGRPVLKDLSFCFPLHAVTVVTGASGVGKTTLLRLLLGLETPDTGEIQGLQSLRVGMVFQEDRLLEHLSAEKNIALACAADASHIRAHLAQVGLADAIQRRVSKLSGGMKRRVAIVRGVLFQAPLVVMDEPFRGLDTHTRALAREYVRTHTQGRTLILVTHDVEDSLALNATAQLILQ